MEAAQPRAAIASRESGTCSACTHFAQTRLFSLECLQLPPKPSQRGDSGTTYYSQSSSPPLSSSLRGAVPSSAASGRQPAKAFSLNLFGGQFHGKRQSRPLVPVVNVTDHPVQHSRRERITRPDRAADAKSILASEALLRGSGGPSKYVSCGCAAPRPTGQHGASVLMSHGR